MLTRLLRGFLAGGRKALPQPCPFPPPYRAMLAINSDVEWTNWERQLVLLRAFADRGLETAFSLWLFSNPNVTWRMFEEDLTPAPEAAAAQQLARAGLFDTNHAMGGRRHQGGCRYDRASIRAAYDILGAAGIRLPVHTNHGSRDDRQNVAGDWADYQEGDLPGSDLYHLDLTLAAGARFFWCDPDYVHEQAMLRPEIDTEQGLFVSGCGRDGNAYLRFRRFLGRLPAGGPSLCNFGQQIGQVLDGASEGYTVVYQHLGVEREPDGKPGVANLPPLRPDAARGLDRLAAAQRDGTVLVTTTARLLRHAALMTARPWRMERQGNGIDISFDGMLTVGGVSWPLEWQDLEGWAIPADGIEEACATLNGERRPLERLTANGAGYFGFPWKRIDMQAAVEQAEQIREAGR